MPAKPIINFQWTISFVALLALFFTGCQTTGQKVATKSVESPACTEVPLTEVRRYLVDCGVSAGLLQEIMAEESTEVALASHTPEGLRAEVAFLADARARVLSDISYYPTRRPVLEVAGALLTQEHLVLQILYYQTVPGKEPIVDTLAERLRGLRERHSELPGGTAAALLAELAAGVAK